MESWGFAGLLRSARWSSSTSWSTGWMRRRWTCIT